MAGSALQVKGLDKVLADLERLGTQAADLRKAWPIIGRLWAEREQRWFQSGGNGTWPALKARTLVRKKGSAPLVASGSLLADLTETKPRYADDHQAAYGPPKGAASLVRGHWHTVGSAYMPARRPVPKITAAERKAMVTAIRKAIMQGVD